MREKFRKESAIEFSTPLTSQQPTMPKRTREFENFDTPSAYNAIFFS